MFFDNLQVIHNRGPLLEETHYYPFGLTMSGISSKAAGKLEDKKNKFQGQEYNDDLGVDVYEFKYRMDDPQIGRFWQVDPLASDYVYNSTYAFSENHVTTHVELEGLEKQYINDPKSTTYGPLNHLTVVGVKNHKSVTNTNVVKQKFGGKPQVSAGLEVRAGAALKVEGVGLDGGTGVTVAGIQDNEFFVGGKNLKTGEITKFDKAGAEMLGSGLEYEKKSVQNANGEFEKTSESETARTGFIFTAKTETDSKKGEKTESFNLNISAAIGIGLVIKIEINIPIYTKVTKEKQ